MRRTDRLFEIIQILRSESLTGSGKAIRAQEIAERLEVSVRTVYRDIQTLQAMRTPIEGEAGVGYMLRRGYDLPPINFSPDETEAIVVGLNLLARTGDVGLQKAAERVVAKIETAHATVDRFEVSPWGTDATDQIDPQALRNALRDEQKLKLVYRNGEDRETTRTIRPIAMIYYVQVNVLVGWCELREDFRHFRLDRILSCEPADAYFIDEGDGLRERWRQSEQTVFS
ncbi:MAG: YafY family protein [Pseudomonadota bacterium]